MVFCKILSYNVWVHVGVVNTWIYILEQSVKVSERRLYYLPGGMFSLWTLWSRSNLIYRIYFTMWHRRVLLITFWEGKQQRRYCSSSGVGSERLKRCRIPTPHAEVQGPGVFDSAMIEAECSLCKAKMGNSSAVWYNSWRLARLDELSIEDRSFCLFSCIFPQVTSLTQHRRQSHLIICGSPLRGLHDNPRKQTWGLFPLSRDLSLDCIFWVVCLSVWSGFTALLSCSRHWDNGFGVRAAGWQGITSSPFYLPIWPEYPPTLPTVPLMASQHTVPLSSLITILKGENTKEKKKMERRAKEGGLTFTRGNEVGSNALRW